MSPIQSRIAVNWSLGALKENKSLAAIRFPFGWDLQVGPIFSWHSQLSCTKFTSIHHRKEREFPFYHEFLYVKLTDGNLCRFERFGDPDARVDAITKEGSVAHDLAEILPSDQLAFLDKTSDVLEEVTFSHDLDLMDILEICYSIQQNKQTRIYTLQRYNCYFFCWCVLLLLTRKAGLQGGALSAMGFDQAIQQLEFDLSKAAPTDHDSLVFLLCRWLAPATSHPEKYVVRALCSELSAASDSILSSLDQQPKPTLWPYEAYRWQKVVRGEICKAGRVADWAQRQTPIWDINTKLGKIAEARRHGFLMIIPSKGDGPAGTAADEISYWDGGIKRKTERRGRTRIEIHPDHEPEPSSKSKFTWVGDALNRPKHAPNHTVSSEAWDGLSGIESSIPSISQNGSSGTITLSLRVVICSWSYSARG